MPNNLIDCLGQGGCVKTLMLLKIINMYKLV